MRYPLFEHPELRTCRARQIDNPFLVAEGPSVGDADANALPGVDARYLDPRTEGQRAVRGRHLVGIESLAVGRAPAGERTAVPSGIAHLYFGARLGIPDRG